MLNQVPPQFLIETLLPINITNVKSSTTPVLVLGTLLPNNITNDKSSTTPVPVVGTLFDPNNLISMYENLFIVLIYNICKILIQGLLCPVCPQNLTCHTKLHPYVPTSNVR